MKLQQLLLESFTTNAKLAALDVQQRLLELPKFDLDVNLSKGVNEGSFKLEYNDKNKLITGKLLFNVDKLNSVPRTHYITLSNGSMLMLSSEGFDCEQIVARFLALDAPFKSFTEEVHSFFPKALKTPNDVLKADELYGLTIHKPFIMPSTTAYIHIKADDIFIVSVCLLITLKSTLRACIYDSRGKEHTIDGLQHDSIEDVFEKVCNFYKKRTVNKAP